MVSYIPPFHFWLAHFNLSFIYSSLNDFSLIVTGHNSVVTCVYIRNGIHGNLIFVYLILDVQCVLETVKKGKRPARGDCKKRKKAREILHFIDTREFAF